MKRFARVKTVAQRYDVSPATIWRWANDPRFAHLGFPKPEKVGPSVTAWDVDELDAHDKRRVEQHDSEAA